MALQFQTQTGKTASTTQLSHLQAMLGATRTKPPFDVNINKHTYAQFFTRISEAASAQGALVTHVLASPSDALSVTHNGPGVANFIALHLPELLHCVPLEALSSAQQVTVLQKAQCAKSIVGAVALEPTKIVFMDKHGNPAELSQDITIEELANHSPAMVFNLETAQAISQISGKEYEALRKRVQSLLEIDYPIDLVADLADNQDEEEDQDNHPHITDMRVTAGHQAFTRKEFQDRFGENWAEHWSNASPITRWGDSYYWKSPSSGDYWAEVTDFTRPDNVDWTLRDENSDSEPDEEQTNLEKIMNWLDCNVVQPALAAIQDATRTPPLSQLGNSGSGSKAIQVAATVAIEQALQLQAKSNADGAMTVHRTSQQKRTYDLLHPQVARLVDEHSAHQAVVYELLLAIVGSPVQMMKDPTLTDRGDMGLEDLTGTPTPAFNVSQGLQGQMQSTSSSEYIRERLNAMAMLRFADNPSGDELVHAAAYLLEEAKELRNRHAASFNPKDVSFLVDSLSRGIVELTASPLMKQIKARLDKVTESAYNALVHGPASASSTARTTYGMISMLIHELQDIGKSLALAEAQQQSHLALTHGKTAKAASKICQSLSRAGSRNTSRNTTAFASVPELPPSTSIYANQLRTIKPTSGPTSNPANGGTAPKGIVCPYEWAAKRDKEGNRTCRFGANCRNVLLHGKIWEDFSTDTLELLRCQNCKKHRCPFAFNTRAKCHGEAAGGTSSSKAAKTGAQKDSEKRNHKREKQLELKLRQSRKDVRTLLNQVASTSSPASSPSSPSPSTASPDDGSNATDAPSTATIAATDSNPSSSSNEKVLEAIRKRAAERSSKSKNKDNKKRPRAHK